MLRDKKPPSGPRPDYRSFKAQENYDLKAVREPTLKSSSRNNLSRISFGGHADENLGGSYEFLPSPSFDDLHSSITSSSNEFDFERLGEIGSSVAGAKRPTEKMNTSTSTPEVRSNGTTRGPVSGPRPARTGSIVRRQSTSTRQSSASSTATASAVPGSMDPPSAPISARNRRQSQYPPISGSATLNAVKAPRKSIGPGVVESDHTRATQRRRPSLALSASSQGQSEAAGASTRVHIGGAPTYMDGARGLTASRAAKTKSLQPPSRQSQTQWAAKRVTPDHMRSSSYAGRSPGRPNGRVTTTPSSTAKRMSVMPGMPTSSSHATGLGARTVSPTDARRARRLSVLQGPPPMPNTPPTPQPETPTIRTSSRSPSMLPRKVSTPSSSGTTPDLNRKSYSSGLSNASNQSHNVTCRTSTGSLQPRMSLPASSSRLPTPKPRNTHSSAGNNEEEEVPPVPAIPKAYESPKDSPVEPPFFVKRMSSIPLDANSINSTLTNSQSGKGHIRDPPKNDREPRNRQHGPTSTQDDQQTAAPVKKNLQPLRLPPLNLLPLSTPTAAKIAALEKDPVHSDGQTTPPPRRTNAKTPSSPMTASKASFFSRKRNESNAETHLAHMRSSSSIHFLRSESSSQHGGSSSESSKPIPMNSRQKRQTVSPFISSSLPKNSGEHSFMPRSKTSGDVSMQETVASEPPRPARLTGPRAQKLLKPINTETPTRISSPEDSSTPSSGTSLRRKLSLGWKRTTSKSNIGTSHAANERCSEYPPQPPRHDMPPPRLPASATVNSLNNANVPSPSPSVKSTTYLDSKRRKSSISSMNVFGGHDRTRSDSWGLSGSPKKEKPNPPADKLLSSARSTSTMHKMLSSKNSSSTISTTKIADRWTMDLDKDDLTAEAEVKKLGLRRKDTEHAAAILDALYQRANPQDGVSPQQALQRRDLNIFERGEIIDYKDIYFTGTPTAAKHVGELGADSANFGYDDERGDYNIVTGDHLSYRYEIVDVLGKGSFGQVVRCVDHKLGGLVAVKIIRNKKRFHQQALVEVNILQKLREWDPKNRHSMVSFTQSFYFRGHLCISTELLDMNLYEFIKANSFKGFSLKLVRRFTKQMLTSLVLLKQHKVIHCDLKPENILLTHPLHSEIKVIDFGSSCFENEKVYTYIQSRFYRSPEVILGMTYGMPIDMWSLGCILAELFTGVPIFPGENEQEQLACIMEVFGPPGKHLVDKSTRKKLFFDSMGKPRLTVSSKGRRRRPSSKSLDQVLKCNDEVFLDFLTRCLRWDPDTRMKPEEAIRHEFLSGQKSAALLPRMAGRNESPIKRSSAIVPASSGSNRPLPEPPATSFKNGTAVRPREPSGSSPTKSTATARRQSTVSGLATTGNKRTSTGVVLTTGNSGLPRVTRSTSGRIDHVAGMASVGASIAMGKR